MIPGGAEGAFRFAAAVCSDPVAALRRWGLRSGGKTVGCAPLYVPEEVIHAAGALPVTVWGNETSPPPAGGIPPFLCAVARGLHAAVRGPLGGSVDAWVFPSTCDTLQNLPEVLRMGEDPRPVFPLVFPASGKIGGAAEYLLDRFEALREWTEDLCGRAVSEGALERSIRVLNENRRHFSLLEQRMAEEPGAFSAAEFLLLARSGMVLPKEQHTRVLEAARSRSGGRLSRPRAKIFLGGMVAPAGLMDALDGAGAALVGNDLGLGHRYYAGPAEEAGDPLLSLVRRHLAREPCPTLPGTGDERVPVLFDRVRSTGADRFLFVRVRQCDPEGGEIPGVAAAARERGIPFLLVDTDLSGAENASLKVRVEAFVEMGE